MESALDYDHPDYPVSFNPPSNVIPINVTESAMSDTFNPDEPTTVHSFFERISNTIVEASKLAKDVAALRCEVDALRRDVEIYRERNGRLDEEVNRLRAEREEQRRQIAELQIALSKRNTQLDDQHLEIERLSKDVGRWQDSHTEMASRYQDAVKGWDIAELRVMELGDKIKDLETENGVYRDRANSAEGALNTIRNVLNPQPPAVSPNVADKSNQFGW